MTQQERQAHSRAEILHAAMEEFGSRDYDQVTMESICKNHGISKGMMYHYYSNKDELFLLCVQEMFLALKAQAEQNTAPPGTADILTDIQSFFLSREYFLQSHPKYQRIFENAMLHPPEHLQQQIQALREPLRRLNWAFLEQLTSAMPLRPGVEREQVTHYLENMELVFRDVLLRYQGQQQTQNVHTMLKSATEILDMLLFGVLRQDPRG